MSTSTALTHANQCLLETAAQPKKKSKQFLDRKTASPKLGQAPGHIPFLLVAKLPKRTRVKEDLKPVNTITEGSGTKGSRHLGKDTQDLPPQESCRADALTP